MFFNVLKNKKLWIFFLFFNIVFAVSSLDKFSFYGIITRLESENDSLPLLYSNKNNNDHSFTLNMRSPIHSDTTIITYDNQNIEIIFYNGIKAIGMLYVKENTDINIKYNEEQKKVIFKFTYGGFRAVFDNNYLAFISTQGMTLEQSGSDIGIISTINASGKPSGYVIVFGSEVNFYSTSNPDKMFNLKKFQHSEFEKDQIIQTRLSTKEELMSWHESMIFLTENIPQNIPLALETLFQESVQEEDATDDKQNVMTQDNLQKIFSAFLSFEAGVMTYNKNIGLKFVYRPGTSFFGDKFEFGFYFPFNIIPSRAFTSNAFMPLNEDNNEWSFGSDKIGNTEAVVFDAFDDVLLKIRTIRYNFPEEPIYINFGQHFNVSDFLNYSLLDFNPVIFFPQKRNSSFYTQFKFPWLEAFIYAEDVLPKGLYGTDMVFMTPAKSFRFKFRISAYLDAYDLMKFTDEESVFPAQFNTSLSFDSFNVHSFGFSLFFNGGYYLPLTYNFHTQSSLFNDLAAINSSALTAGMSFSTGFHLRIVDFSVDGEFIVDSGLNKVSLFDPLYMAKREYHSGQIKSWINNAANRQVDLNDFNFGFRAKFSYVFLNHINLQTFYLITFPVYYDKLFFKLTISTGEKLKVVLDFFILWEFEIVSHLFMDQTSFQLSNLGYFGMSIKPNKVISVNVRAGIYPDFTTAVDPWYSKMMMDLYITIKPLPHFEKAGGEATQSNL